MKALQEKTAEKIINNLASCILPSRKVESAVIEAMNGELIASVRISLI